MHHPAYKGGKVFWFDNLKILNLASEKQNI